METAESLKQFGISAKAYKVDVSKFDEIENLKQEILNDLGEVDILVNNAGIIAYKTIFDQSAEEIERLTNVNFNAVILVSFESSKSSMFKTTFCRCQNVSSRT